MKEGYRFLGEYIRQVDIRNKEGKKENLLGVSVQKQFIQSIANTVGTDFTKYKVVKKGQFTYIPDEAYANEVLDDVAEQLAQLLSELKTEKNSFKNMGIDYEEKAFYDILKAVSKKFEFEYPDDKMIELSKRIKLIVDDKSRYTDWSARDDIKANLQVDLILLLDEFGYPPVTIDDVYKEVLEQAENFKKYAQ